VLGQEMLDGKLHGVGQLRDLAALTGASIAFAFGDPGYVAQGGRNAGGGR
jgi:hypothetical protein